MLEGYPLRKYTWKDWLLMILTSSIFVQVFLVTTFSSILTVASLQMPEVNITPDMVVKVINNGSVIGIVLSLPLTLLVVHWQKIPLINRKQLSKEESFGLPGLTKDDWSFLIRYIPISYILYYVGAIIVHSLFTNTEAINQIAVEGLFDYYPAWLMFIMVVIVAPIVEELLFRGIMLFRGHRLETTWPRTIISALIFGLIHSPTNIPSFYSYVGMGFIFSYAAKRTQTVEAAIVYHFLNNLLAFISLMSLR